MLKNMKSAKFQWYSEYEKLDNKNFYLNTLNGWIDNFTKMPEDKNFINS